MSVLWTINRRSVLVPSIVAAALLLGSAAGAQVPSLQISAPDDGAIVAPGSTVGVTVTSPASTVFSQVVVIGQRPVDLTGLSSTLPFQTPATIPADVALRRYRLSAIGRTPAGQEVDATPIFIDVERLDMPASLMLPNGTSLRFESAGAVLPVLVVARFGDGADLDVTESSRVSYSVANPQVASVSPTGLVTALGAGQTTVTVLYTLGAQTLQAQVAVVVPQAVLAAAPQVLAFGDQNVGTAVTQQITLTNNGVGPVSVLNVASVGDFSAAGDCVNASLDPGASCSIAVTFAPSSSGARDASLEIETSFYSLPIGVPLSGSGVGQGASTTTLASSSPVSVFGQTVTLSATVAGDSGGTPSGTVTFTDGAVVLGVEPLVNGVAALTAGSSWTPGTRTIVATFDGNDQFGGSSGSLTQVVNRAATQTIATASASPVILGDSVTLVATVAVTAPGSGVPSGTITFRDGPTVLTTAPISVSGEASTQLSSLGAGAHSLTATYGGDGNFDSSTGALTLPVQYQPATVLCQGQPGRTVLSPLNADGTSVFNRNRVVPVKFRVCDTAGYSIGTPDVVRSFTITAVTHGTTSDVNEEVPSATPDTAFRWDASAAQWIFNIDTHSQSSDTTYHYTITLDDSTTITFQYGLR